VEDTHDNHSIRSDCVEDAMTLAIELPKRAGSSGNWAAEIRRIGNPLE
jgi:hypothetical protein